MVVVVATTRADLLSNGCWLPAGQMVLWQFLLLLLVVVGLIHDWDFQVCKHGHFWTVEFVF